MSSAVLEEEHQLNDDWAKFYYAPPLRMQSSTDADKAAVVELPSFIDLQSATRQYREMAEGAVKKLAMSHEVALRTEEIFFPIRDHTAESKSQSSIQRTSLSHHLEKKISKTAELLEHNAFVLEEILKPFPISSLLESSKVEFHDICTSFTAEAPSADYSLARYIPPHDGTTKANGDNVNEEQPYKEAVQIIAHLTRDWSKEGAVIRDEIYGWIKEQLWRHHYEMILTAESAVMTSPLSPILIPGAGIGRLAFDIAFAHDEECTSDCFVPYPFAVEAMDNSLTMAAAAHHLFHAHECDVVFRNGNITNIHGQLKLYPFVSDSHTNEVDTQRRWDSVEIPEESVMKHLHNLHEQLHHQRPKLSYTIGDFVTTYSSPSKRRKYGSLVSLFFIDTATNIYEYILTIRHLLRNGGVWVNLGPVQWHSNSQLHPATNELREMIQSVGFQVKHWEISEKLVAYRHPDDLDSSHSQERGSRSTRSEAYRPLKFVAVLKYDKSSENSQNECLLSSIQKVRLMTGRRSIANLDNITR